MSGLQLPWFHLFWSFLYNVIGDWLLWERKRTHTHSQFVSVNAANHPHILVLSWREKPEDKQQLLSHHLSLYPSHPHHPLFITSFFPRLPFLQLYCSPSLPQFSSIYFISLQSELYWFSHGLSCHISISLNSLACRLFCSSQCCFHFHKYTYTQFLTLVPPSP